jgi:hypothetical protein
VLWGFGVFFGDAAGGGLFLKRYKWTPRLTARPLPPWGLWHPGYLPPARDPESPDERRWLQALYTDALQWIASYEQWVARRFGREYRRRCVAGWARALTPADAMAAAWNALACAEASAATSAMT